jgi:diaminohydroxyphosphoribosylaminopyrimidine deaminase/5-amino-6-(5-phosphoribosylamino)uracil reductase
VTGNGLKFLKERGINVKSGLLEKDGCRLNEIYFKNITTNMPFVTLKAAMSLDGYIYSPESHNRYLSSKPFLEYVHCLRAGYDAVLIGAGTANFDDPRLNVRYKNGADPAKIIVTDGRPLSPDLKVFNSGSKARTIVAMSSRIKNNGINKNAEIWTIKSRSNKLPLISLLEKAAAEGITSILVEGGSDVFNSFISQKAFDKIIISHTPYLYGDGVPFRKIKAKDSNLKYLKFKSHRWERLGEDSVFIGYPDFNERRN